MRLHTTLHIDAMEAITAKVCTQSLYLFDMKQKDFFCRICNDFHQRPTLDSIMF